MNDESLVEQAKDQLAGPEGRIELHETLLELSRTASLELSEEHFPLGAGWSDEEFRARVARYEAATRDLRRVLELVGFWGENYNQRSLLTPPLLLLENMEQAGGTSGWIALRWYPLLLLMYSAGISGVAAARFENVKAILGKEIRSTLRAGERESFVTAVIAGLSNTGDAFRKIEGLEKRKTARSDHLVEVLHDEIMSLGLSELEYEEAFDRFELILALEHAHLDARAGRSRFWGPVGRFSWRHRHTDGGPLGEMIREAKHKGDDWELTKAGLFGGSTERYLEVAGAYMEWLAKVV